VSVLCSAVAVALPTLGNDLIGTRLWSHIESCADCQTRHAGYREMHDELADLRFVQIPAPIGLSQKVMASLGPVAVPDLDDGWDHVVPVAAAAALATAAAGTAVLVKLYRHRAA